VIIKEQKQRRIVDRGSWGRCSCVTYGTEVVRRYGTGGTEKQKVEEQRE